MKIGLFFGSFNPIHIGHLILANHLSEYTDLQEIWLVVTPHNPLKNKKTLVSDNHRYEMVNIALKNYEKLKPCDVEFYLPKPSYTNYTLLYLKEKYPKNDFHLIMGEDNLQHFHKWKNYENILEYHEMYVYPRILKTNTIPKISSSKIKKIKAPIIQISAREIRTAIKNQKNVKPLLCPKVCEYIDKIGLYLK